MLDISNMLEDMHVFIKNEENHLFSSSMMIVSKLLHDIISSRGKVSGDNMVETPLKNLKKHITKLERLEVSKPSANIVRQIRAIKKEIERESRIIICRTLQMHNILNSTFAMLNNVSQDNDPMFNYTAGLNKIIDNGNISNDQIKLFRYLNKFRNVIAHSTGYDTMVNLNSGRIDLLLEFFNKYRIEFHIFIIENAIDISKYAKNNLVQKLPKNKLKFV
jgi:uncharacterized protein YutE (UPF0331/DUF86 family)